MVGVPPKPTTLSVKPAPAALPEAATANFGGLLRFLRRRAQLSQRELGLAVGYSESQISRLERNDRLPDMTALAALYLPALHLEDDPAAAAQLMALAAMARGEALPPDSGAGLPAPRPPASPEAAPVSRLPNALTPFIGREREMAEVIRLLKTSRVLTLTGAGGCGKTRLAFHVAADLAGHYRHGVFAVELAALADPALVLPAVARAFSLSEAPSQSLLDTLLGYLQPRQVLLVLDNCEHLILACAQLVETLLRACPDLQVLATSREGLGISGEITWPVPGLALPDAGAELTLERLAGFDALRLFMQRARAALPSFELGEHNRAAVAEICQKLEGIPLAIELAAPLVRALSPAEIAARLAERFRLLIGGSRTALPRHQTLRGAIDWSYELLSEPERALLRRLSVFVGGWSLEAAEQVGAGTGDVLDLLKQLVAKSLVLSEQLPGKAARFRMLETIREYALDNLALAGETRAARSRHLAFYVAFAEKARPELRHHRQAEWEGRLEAEADNLRAALTWALEQEDAEAALRMTGALFEWNLGHHEDPEWFQWLSAALRLPANQGALERSAWRARALMGAGCLGLYAELATRRAWLAESLSIYR
jgi:predicted ATPase/transcriptional regulator with XRE-family HTH domain